MGGLPRPVRFLRRLESDPSVPIGDALADLDANEHDLRKWREQKDFERRYTQLAHERKQPQNQKPADPGTMRAALQIFGEHPNRGLATACSSAGISLARFMEAKDNDEEYQELYSLAMTRAIMPIEERHLETMAADPKAGSDRRAFFSAQIPGTYTPTSDGTGGTGGGVHVTVNAELTAIAASLVGDLARARVDDKGRALPKDVPLDLLEAGGDRNTFKMLLEERQAEKVEVEA